MHAERCVMDNSSSMSPASVSPLFPDRPIRPLPKRRLRETLLPEVADSITYPPSAHDNVPLFYYPSYTPRDETNSTSPVSGRFTEPGRRAGPSPHTTPQRNGRSAQGGDDEPGSRSTLVTRSPPDILSRNSRRPSRSSQARGADPQPTSPATFPVDGYEAFENTNNKKKRKIPSAGDFALLGSHGLHADGSTPNMPGIPLDRDQHGDRFYPHSNSYAGPSSHLSNGQGVSGSGRGRLGRPRSARSPLRALSDGNNTWSTRSTKTGQPQWAHPDYHESSGIISSAIANAEKMRPQRQENVSLLQQHSSAKAESMTQFTFTCNSQVPGNIQWPGHASRYGPGAHNAPGVSQPSHTNSSSHHDGSSKATSGASVPSRRRARRRLERELALAAQHRQDFAAEAWFHNPPKLDDIWICEFCEYERIFGEPPRALIRDYEMKDRRHRQEEADRKRLLEKAKAKSRKGKKSSKSGKGAGHNHHGMGHPHAEHIEDEGAPPMHHGHSHSTQSEEDYEDEFEDEYSNHASHSYSSLTNGRGAPIPSRDKT